MLIDGGHGFPTPYIDWFYTAGNLKKGGFVLVDDVWLWSCQILRDFLGAQPEWEFVNEYEGRTAVFRKIEDGSEWLEWTQQPMVARGGRLRYIDGQVTLTAPQVANNSSNNSSAMGRALTDLKSGNFKTIARKIAKRISRSN